MYYQIVPMDRSHIEQIARLEQACFSSPWTENMLADALFDTQASFIVAEDEEGNVLGSLVNVSANSRVLNEDGVISMEKFKPLVFDHATYDYLKVDGVVGKAFEEGKKLK